ncbi:MAG: DUF433 domain-containing protein [bacterium]|nr:DUF433 domain-containing protein [bacterium]
MAKMLTKVGHSYIVRNHKIHGEEPIIEGTRFPVRSIVFYVLKEGMLPEELVDEFPHLTLPAIYDALSYYYDHREEIDNLLKENIEEIWKTRM